MRKNNGKGRGTSQDGRGSLSQDERGLWCPVGFGIIRAASQGSVSVSHCWQGVRSQGWVTGSGTAPPGGSVEPWLLSLSFTCSLEMLRKHGISRCQVPRTDSATCNLRYRTGIKLSED